MKKGCGRAGRDIAVAGFDNQDIAEYFVPGLTTTALPLKEIGHTSAQILLDQLEGGSGEKENVCEKKVYIPCSFVERDSVQQI